MDIEDIVVMFFLAVCIVVTTIVFVADFRHYDVIMKECQTMGYIQNDKTRILCSPEKLINKN